MTIRASRHYFLWMAAGALVFLAITLAVSFLTGGNPSQRLASKTKRADLVAQMRLTLASASEAEKSAVLAVTDEDSRALADQARAATAELEREREELAQLLAVDGTQKERDLLAEFSRVFVDFQRIVSDLLDLAVRNTNIKAYGLTFGPAADALEEMDTALSRLVAKTGNLQEAKEIAQLAFGAQSAALHIQTLLAPHIAEEGDKNMDELEAGMTEEDQKVRKDLNDLAVIRRLRRDNDLAAAAAAYARFSEVRGRILGLSRENTNVRSLAMSLGQARNILLLCQDALSALQQAILAERIAGIDYRVPPNPRGLGTE